MKNDPHAYRIVIADDEGVIRMGLKTMLRALGHRVVATARNGVETIEMVRQFQPDLLLLDIKMPEMDGLAVANHLANEAPLPIVMLTAYSERTLIEQAIKSTAVEGYLVKPVDESKLAPVINLAITRFAERTSVVTEAHRLRQRLAGRDVITQAKRILMAQEGLSEHEAYHHLQLSARKKQLNLEAVAQTIVDNNSKKNATQRREHTG